MRSALPALTLSTLDPSSQSGCCASSRPPSATPAARTSAASRPSSSPCTECQEAASLRSSCGCAKHHSSQPLPRVFSLCRSPAGDASITSALCLCGRQGMSVGEPSYVAEPLLLGILSGNEFTVTLRDLRALPSDPAAPAAAAAEPAEALEARVRTAVAALRNSGFVNYFGLQRFGASAGARTHVVGAAVLRGDWAAAVDLILGPRADEVRRLCLCSK